MKLLILLSIGLLGTNGFEIPPSIRDAIVDLHRECAKETGVLHEHIRKCEENHIPEDADVKCYLACLHDNISVDLAKGIADIQGAQLKMSDDVHDLVDHLKKQCKDEDFNHPDKCEAAWLKTNCHLKAHEDVQHFCDIVKLAEI